MTDTSILILEDEPLIALDVETLLNECGFANLHFFKSAEQAESWLESHTPRLAILDYYLGQSTSESVADALIRMGVPFIVCSAAEKSETSSAFAKGHWVSKPFDSDQLIVAVLRLLKERLDDEQPAPRL